MKAIALAVVGLLALASASSDKKIVCYYTDWAVWRQGNGKFDTSKVDPSLCTHMIYSFVLPKEDGSIAPGAQFQQFLQLRNQNPSLKLMVAIGGWTEGSARFSKIAANPQLRQTFVQNVYNLVKQNGFDGFDVDWEYPTQNTGAPADKANFVQLLKELKEKLSPDGLLLSAAVAIGQWTADQSYEIAQISKHLDFINLMAYDMHGDWDLVANHHAPLYGASWESDKKANIDSAIKYWTQHGAPIEKLVLGVPFYGKSFALTSQSNKPGAPAGKGAHAGPYTQQSGFLNYNEICEKIKNENWKSQEEPEQQVPYASGGNQWVGYDNEKSLEKKANYVNTNGLGGIMIWSIDGDDFNGVCGNEKFPLLKAINRALKGASSPPVSKNVNNNEVSNSVSGEYKQESANNGYDGGYNSWQQEKNEVESNGIEETQNNEVESNRIEETQDNYDSQWQQESKKSDDPAQLCKADGYVKDPKNPAQFYYCQSLNGQFITYAYQPCSPGLVFDTCTQTCNWPQNSC